MEEFKEINDYYEMKTTVIEALYDIIHADNGDIKGALKTISSALDGYRAKYVLKKDELELES